MVSPSMVGARFLTRYRDEANGSAPVRARERNRPATVEAFGTKRWRAHMLAYAAVFLLVALIAGILGLTNLSGVVKRVSLVLFALFFLMFLALLSFAWLAGDTI